jgi:hypothetical protein
MVHVYTQCYIFTVIWTLVTKFTVLTEPSKVTHYDVVCPEICHHQLWHQKTSFDLAHFVVSKLCMHDIGSHLGWSKHQQRHALACHLIVMIFITVT